MILIYRFFINLIFIFSPLIILVRLLKKKKTPKDLRRNFVFFQKKKRVEI